MTRFLLLALTGFFFLNVRLSQLVNLFCWNVEFSAVTKPSISLSQSREKDKEPTRDAREARDSTNIRWDEENECVWGWMITSFRYQHLMSSFVAFAVEFHNSTRSRNVTRRKTACSCRFSRFLCEISFESKMYNTLASTWSEWNIHRLIEFLTDLWTRQILCGYPFWAKSSFYYGNKAPINAWKQLHALDVAPEFNLGISWC